MTLMIYIFKQSYYICLFTGMLKHLISYLFVFLAQIYIWDFIKKLGSQLWSWLQKLGVWHTCDVQNRLLAYNIWKNCLYSVAAHLIGLLDSVEYGKSTIILTSIFLSAITSDVPVALGGYVDSLCGIDVSTELAGSSDITCLVSIY